MPAISEIIIRKPATHVWSIIADPKTHPRWLGQDTITAYQDDAELAEGITFIRRNEKTGITTEGEVVSVISAMFLKVRVNGPDNFVITEYHLIAVAEGCAVRVTAEVYDTGDAKHVFFPEIIEDLWRSNLQRLKVICER